MNTNTFTNTTKAGSLDRITGKFNYKPADPTAELIYGFEAIMRVRYNLGVPTYFIETLINAIGTDETTKQGNFAKRFINQWKAYNQLPHSDHKFYPYKPVTEAGAVVGDLFKQIFGKKERTVFYRITTDIRDILEDPERSDGYGNPNSCWYADGCYSESPYILENAGGAAILLGTSEPVTVKNGIGRIFLVNGEDGLTMFNPYLELNDGRNRNNSDLFEFFSRILAQILGYKENETQPGEYIKDGQDPAHFEMKYFDSPESIYINRDMGWIFTTKRCPNIGAPFGSEYYCTYCEEHLNEDEVYYTPDGEPVCEYCFSEHFTICNRCNETLSIDDTYTDEFETYCHYCYRQTHETCTNCEAEINTDYEEVYKTDDDEPLCEQCYKDYIAQQEAEAETEN